jgi:hypothetical protein
MKIIKITIITIILTLTFCKTISAQELSKTQSAKIENFPEYVIITSQNTKLFGGIGIFIDSKKSKYEENLDNLAELLQSKSGLRVRNQTDLLNAMSQLGFDYINSYNAEAIMPDSDGEDLLDIIDGGEGTFKINMVFRKKEKYRE